LKNRLQVLQVMILSNKTFCDIFAGIGIVGSKFKTKIKQVYRIIKGQLIVKEAKLLKFLEN